MRTLADAESLQAITARLTRVSPDVHPSWGVMTASQMVAHLDGAFQMAMGTMAVVPRLLPLTTAVRWLVLRTPVSWPHSTPTVKELDVRYLVPLPDHFAAQRTRLAGRIHEFSKLESGCLLAAHPMLGPMTRWEWMRWGYLHTDHHLRQFGC